MATFVRVQEIEHEIGPAGRFALRVTSPDVELRAVSGGIARVRVEFELRASDEGAADDAFENARFRVHATPGALEVGEPKSSGSGLEAIGRLLGGVSGVRVDARVVADIPAGASVSYAGVSADVTAVGLRGEQDYNTVSGDLVLSDLGGPIRVRGVSSDISVRAEAPISLEANTVSGDLIAVAPRIEESRVVTVSGDVELEGDLAAGPGHRVETVSGDLALGIVGGLTLEVRGLSSDVRVSLDHRSEGSRDRRRYVIGNGRATLQFSSMSGDVVVRGARRAFRTPPTPPAPPTPPTDPTAPTPPARTITEAEQLEVLQALERGEIDVDEAARRLAGGGTDV